ncbi:TIGR04255 family protein [Candidatus Competibacter phosphatis]|uniref:TIGR04255 family protein n=1 Tax=Candidatus Competibacter phosphatis TaxID=221280 RepID=A0ABX1TS90_9GAMM|nr:TIGR04255 family protein [Candidatus Competibacter phosphatis]
MRLKQWDRVRYTKNPLVEVVAQVRFPRVLEIDDQLPSDFQRALRQDYPLLEVQEETLAVMIGQGPNKMMADDLPRRTTVYHFIAPDRVWRISLASEFLALTCTNYEKWEDFRPRMMVGLETVAKLYPIIYWTRLGLRYRDLINRENIGLTNVSWRELLAPFLLGATIADPLIEDDSIPETDVLAAQSYVSFQLEDCVLGLRHGIVRKEQNGDSSAYQIDADFYLDNQIARFDLDAIKRHLDRFHANAGAVFRGCIQERLHDALDPQPISS